MLATVGRYEQYAQPAPREALFGGRGLDLQPSRARSGVRLIPLNEMRERSQQGAGK